MGPGWSTHISPDSSATVSDAAVVLVVFDARSEADPLMGVRYWSKAIDQAEVSERNSSRIKRLLVEARVDRGDVNMTPTSLVKAARDLGFIDVYRTSAKENYGIELLAAAIRRAIDWNALPRVSSTELFQIINAFLLEEKEAGRLLSSAEDLYRTFVRHPESPNDDGTLSSQFKTCIRLMGSRGLIRRLSFGNLVLLQPELLDVYASAMVNAAKTEPDGLGSITEEDARSGRFAVPHDQRVIDNDQEKLLLIATVEDLLFHEIALREYADEGTYLVFPSQLTRRNPALSDPEGKAVVFAFAGPVGNIYATLAVRLSHSGLFRKKALWQNAAAYEAAAGGTCGMVVREIDDGYAELTLFYEPQVSVQTRFQFEDYIYTHLSRKSVLGSIERYPVFVCDVCGFLVPRQLIKIRAAQKLDWINCPGCSNEKTISLVDRERKLAPSSRRVVPEMDRAADVQREFDTGLVSAVGQLRTSDFAEWAGSMQTTAAIVFTDAVGSTALANQSGMSQ